MLFIITCFKLTIILLHFSFLLVGRFGHETYNLLPPAHSASDSFNSKGSSNILLLVDNVYFLMFGQIDAKGGIRDGSVFMNNVLNEKMSSNNIVY